PTLSPLSLHAALPICRRERRHRRRIDAFELQDGFSIEAYCGPSTRASAFKGAGAMNISMFSRDSSQWSKTRSTTVSSSWAAMARSEEHTSELQSRENL